MTLGGPHSFSCGPDLTGLCVRLAQRLRDSGCEYPAAGAVALAARGHAGLDQPAFAVTLGVPLAELQSAEAGSTSWCELPPSLVDSFESGPIVDVARLRYLTDRGAE